MIYEIYAQAWCRLAPLLQGGGGRFSNGEALKRLSFYS
jgi:hypothetical protein